MTYLPWAGSLQSDSAHDPADPERAGNAHGSRPHSSPSPRDTDGYASQDRPVTRDSPDSQDPDSRDSPAGAAARSPEPPDAVAGEGRPGRARNYPDPAAVGQEISRRLFSAGCDLHFALMTVRDEPARYRLEHAVHEVDDAIRELRHLMLAILERLA